MLPNSSQHSPLLLRTLIRALPDLVWLKDCNGVYLACNERFERFFGAAESALVGKTDYDFVPRELADWFRDHDRKAIEADGPTMNEEEITFADDGHREWIETIKSPFRGEDGELIGVLGVARDISWRKRAEAALRETELRYEMLFQSSGTANAIYDINGRILLANRLYCQFMGVGEQGAVGRSLGDFLGQEHFERCKERIARVLESGKPDISISELELPGGARWMQVSYSPLYDGNGVPLGAQAIGLDVTENHHLQTKQQEHAKLESIGFLAGGIAHDVNNLLAGLLGQIEVAKLRLVEGKADEALGRLHKTDGVFTRAKALTNQLLTFSRGGTPIRTLHQLGPSLRDWSAFALSGSNLNLQMDIPRDLWPCECDSQQISQVIDNLLINARQASPPRGTIVVRAENVVGTPPLVRVWIADQGPGVSPEIATKIFQPFFTTKASGTGLGLATSRSILEQHGGELALQSAPGTGATFIVTLPASPGRRTLARYVPKRTFKGEGWALIMDDEEALRDAIGSILTALGFQLLRARDGHDALLYYDDLIARGQTLELAVLDLTIPGGMGGFETARRLRERGSRAIFVAMSGYSEESGKIVAGAEGGFGGQLSKPFSMGDLSQLLLRLFPASPDSDTRQRLEPGSPEA